MLYVFLQIVILKRIDLSYGNFDFIHVFIYPLFILLLPLSFVPLLVLSLAFFMGITIDFFYDSPGVHASAMVFVAYIRKPILSFLEPRKGYDLIKPPSLQQMGLSWFASYISIILFLFLLFYFSVEAFSFIYYFDIAMRTIFSFIASLIIVFLHQLISNTRR